VIRRTRGALFGFSDSYLFNQSPESVSFLESFFGSKEPVTTMSAISNLCICDGYVVFCWKESVYVYSEHRSSIVARLVKARPHDFDYDFDVIFNKKYFFYQMGR